MLSIAVMSQDVDNGLHEVLITATKLEGRLVVQGLARRRMCRGVGTDISGSTNLPSVCRSGSPLPTNCITHR